MTGVAHKSMPARFSFSGHETFPFRYTWLPKGVAAAAADPGIFGQEEAMASLGVGKNMVRSIRHWCDAVGLLEPEGRGGGWTPTPFGESLFGQEGWDPYLEDPGTLWLLHWRLVSRRERASAWFLVFGKLSLDRFTTDELVGVLLREAEADPNCRVTRASMKRDVDVLVRTYAPSESKRTLPLEDTFDCPLVELGILERTGRSSFSLRRTEGTALPSRVLAYAILDFWLQRAPDQPTLSFETLMHAEGSPGRAFMLTPSALARHLEDLPPDCQLRFDATAGIRQVLTAKPITAMDSGRQLQKYYRTRARLERVS